MTFLITFGTWAGLRVEFTRGVFLRVVLGFVAFWWFRSDFERVLAGLNLMRTEKEKSE